MFCKGETNFDGTREAPLSEFMHTIHNVIELARAPDVFYKDIFGAGSTGTLVHGACDCAGLKCILNFCATPTFKSRFSKDWLLQTSLSGGCPGINQAKRRTRRACGPN